MKKLLTAVLLLASPSVFALDAGSNTFWTCRAPNFGSTLSGANQYCISNDITSATTVAQIGSLNIDMGDRVVVSTVGTATISTSLGFSVGGVAAGSQTVSASATGNVINLGPVYFDALAVSPTAGLTGVNSFRALVVEQR